MKRSPILIAILLLSLLLFSCELFIEEPQAGKVYAIFVALDYKHLENKDNHLNGTIPDAKEQEQAFAKISVNAGLDYHSFLFIQEGDSVENETEHVIGGETINAYPSPANVEAAIAALKSITQKDDLILFTFSGHAAGGTISLGPPNEKQVLDYDVSDLLDAFSSVKGRKLVILDACKTGLSIPIDPASSSTLLENSIATWYAKYFSSNRSAKNDLFVMTSSAATDSYEIPFDGVTHGVFTHALLRGLGWNQSKGDLTTTIPPAAKGNRLTVDGLLTYIKKNQFFPIKRTLHNPITTFQHPMVTGGALDMVLFTF
jgi:hypothetical protein